MMQTELQQAIELAQKGETQSARDLLRAITSSHPQNEAAWLWLASVAENRAERIASLQRVLQINPANERAKIALEKLGESLPLNPVEKIMGRKFTWADYAGILLLVAVACYVIFVLAGGLGKNDGDDFISPPTIAASPTPRISQTPSLTPTITNTPRPPQTDAPPVTLGATWTPAPTRTLEPTRTLAPTLTPFPTRTPFVSLTPIPTRTLRPSATPEAEN